MGAEVFQDFATPYGLNPTSAWHGNAASGFDPATGQGSNCGVTGVTTHAKDCESGLQYMQARHYSPVSGRFMSADPIGFLDTSDARYVNRYTYAANDPINLIDPTGENFATRLRTAEIAARSAHYSRNEQNVVPDTQVEAEAVDETGQANLVEMPDAKSIFHQQGVGGEENSKFVSQDGKHEAVYDAGGNLVEDDVNQGTYNRSSPITNPVGHVILDVLPYYVYGNAPSDPTRFGERLTAKYKGSLSAKKGDPRLSSSDSGGGGW